ncbi:4-hydroxy-tetrahydrodipicolinate reductase [Desulfovibrio litoralis]|uniref:4-hydroxy-tetrahydrodipicolinate reductase n=1 Tax=Desulfovibrio litoralis DSM 11393 TaxID=1121455 RepID=A0A1M7RXA7_9BACT|nr:4-hydroxy-tetrahydrodipicolinate reductase [Desulfovibrio litoralis]SHN50662.1 dihydrodipicolinate reductase [Desulfovibrio litoralis DSM 11393]
MNTDIIILGANGRMGKILCQLVKEDKDLTLVGVVSRNTEDLSVKNWGCPVSANLEEALRQVDDTKKVVIIDFSSPANSLNVAHTVAKLGGCLVIGSTGFSNEERAELKELAKKTPIFWSSNMSIGVNALLQNLPGLVKALGSDYDIEIMEIHHNKKKDAPSGTAKMLAECVATAKDINLDEHVVYTREGINNARQKDEIGMQALRGGDVIGVHTVYFLGSGERIEVTHHAHSRETFAQGALRAAKWLIKQKPQTLYCMKDLL